MKKPNQSILLSGVVSAVMALSGAAAMAQSSVSDAATSGRMTRVEADTAMKVEQVQAAQQVQADPALLAQPGAVLVTTEVVPTRAEVQAEAEAEARWNGVPHGEAGSPDARPKGGLAEPMVSENSRAAVQAEAVRARDAGETLQNESTLRVRP